MAPRVKLERDEWLRLVTWVDANAPYHSHFINTRAQQQPYDLPADVQLLARSRKFTHVAALRPRRRR